MNAARILHSTYIDLQKAASAMHTSSANVKTVHIGDAIKLNAYAAN